MASVFTTIALIYGSIAIILFCVGISIFKSPEFWWRAQKSYLKRTGIKAQKTRLWDIVLKRSAAIVILFGVFVLVLAYLVAGMN